MTETDHAGLQCRELARRFEVRLPIEGSESKRLSEASPKGYRVPVKQNVSQNQHPFILSPKRQVPGSMPRCFYYLQTADLIPFKESLRHGMSGARQTAGELFDKEPRLRHQILKIPSLLGFSISFSAKQRYSEPFTYGVAASLVIRMGMSEGMGGEVPAL